MFLHFALLLVHLVTCPKLVSSYNSDWLCIADGTQSPDDIETQSCGWFKNSSHPCQSCLVSAEDCKSQQLFARTTNFSCVSLSKLKPPFCLAAIVVSGALIATDQFTCMKTKFEIPSTIVSSSGTQTTLCSGTYTVKSCETHESVFAQRVRDIQDILMAAVQVKCPCVFL